MARFLAVLFLAAMVCATYAFPEPISEPECPANEVFKSCGTACELTCAQPEPRACIRMCIPSCQCKDGYVRTHPRGPCLLLRQCYYED